jgi:hypothetical protein
MFGSRKAVVPLLPLQNEYTGRNTMINSIVMVLLCLVLRAIPNPYGDEQLPDYLIIKGDTIELKSYPLEQLEFEEAPFEYAPNYYELEKCLRGYQATWQVINNKLFLTNLAKVGDPQAKVDIEQYFLKHDYTPIVMNGYVFAEWYSTLLMSYPATISKCAYFEKTYKPQRVRPAIRFESGILKYNRYRGK